MREHILHDFFVGRLDATALSRDLEGSIVLTGSDETGIRIVDLESGDLLVTTQHLIKVCDAVERGLLEPWKVEAIGFCLAVSDHFHWDPTTRDGARVEKVLGLWSAPHTHYPLTRRTVAKARHLLLTGETTFVAQDHEEVPDRTWTPPRVKVVERDLRGAHDL